MRWVRMDFYQLQVLYLVLQIFYKFTNFRLYVSFPNYELVMLFAHDTQLNIVLVCAEKLNRTEKIFPLLFLSIDILDKF